MEFGFEEWLPAAAAAAEAAEDEEDEEAEQEAARRDRDRDWAQRRGAMGDGARYERRGYGDADYGSAGYAPAALRQQQQQQQALRPATEAWLWGAGGYPSQGGQGDGDPRRDGPRPATMQRIEHAAAPPPPPPPPPQRATATCLRYVTVSSAARNRAQHPSPADYALDLDADLRDVAAVRLRGARVPPVLAAFCGGGRETLSVSVPPPPGSPPGADRVQLAVRVAGPLPNAAAAAAAAAPFLNSGASAAGSGCPVLDQLLAALEAALNAAAARAAAAAAAPTWIQFAVRLAPATGVVTLHATGPFWVAAGDGAAYGPDALAGPLGLPPEPAVAAAPAPAGGIISVNLTVYPYALVCPFPNHLLDPADVYLRIEGLDGVRGARAAGAGAGAGAGAAGSAGGSPLVVADCFDVLDGARLSGGGGGGGSFAVHRFRPPLARLTRLRVRLTDAAGAPIDFKNRDHRLDLEFAVAAADGPGQGSRVEWDGDGAAPRACA